MLEDNEKLDSLDFIADKSLHTNIEDLLNANTITQKDIDKYNMNHNASLTVDEFINLMNQAFETSINAEAVAKEVVCNS